jgi:hypothetical protein
MVMSKSFDRGAAKKAGAKRALPKGGGKGASGYKLYTPVKQSTIDNIKKMGMSAALKKAGSSKNAEFVQGVKRMYGADRLKTAMKTANKPVAKSADAARSMAMGKGTNNAKNAKRNQPVAKSADEARSSATKKKITVGQGPNKVTQTPRYTSKRPKPMNPKGLFPGLLGGKKS